MGDILSRPCLSVFILFLYFLTRFSKLLFPWKDRKHISKESCLCQSDLGIIWIIKENANLFAKFKVYIVLNRFHCAFLMHKFSSLCEVFFIFRGPFFSVEEVIYITCNRTLMLCKILFFFLYSVIDQSGFS